MEKRYLCFRHRETREIAKAVDVTGRSESRIERIEMGMLMNIGPDWFVDDLTETELKEAGGVVA